MPAAFGAHFDPDNSETWRTNFNLNPDRRLPTGKHKFGRQNADAPNSAPIINVVSSAPVVSPRRPAIIP